MARKQGGRRKTHAGDGPRRQYNYDPNMQVEWITRDSLRVRRDGFYLVSNAKPIIGPFPSEAAARAVQRGNRPPARAATPADLLNTNRHDGK
jgi:hypothetical protein